MKKTVLLLATAAVGIGVALTYYLFEGAVHHSINLIWNDWLNTGERRLLVLPLCIVLTLVYFGVQHYLDPQAETKEQKGLGETPNFSASNFLKILFIGFLSLVAGASLGPEAVLVPACMVLGGYLGTKLFKKDQPAVKLLTAAGFVALFTAFFSSFFVGLISILLLTKQAKTKINISLLVIAAVASASSYYTLQLLGSEAYATLPHYSWKLNFVTILVSILLIIVGYGAIYATSFAHSLFEKVRKLFKRQWLVRGAVAALGLSALYLAGGPLVEFTGNESIVPMAAQAAELGTLGLLWLAAIKIGAIAWSKALGYRGGMIFPTIFLASVLIAIVELHVHDYNYIYGLIFVLIGAFAANRKTGILV